MNTPKQLAVQSIQVEINFYCIVDRNLYDLGSVTLEKDGRQYILDVVESSTTENNSHTVIICELEVDTETFPFGTNEFECAYDLEVIDLYSLDKATIYIGDEYEVEPDSINLIIVNNNSTFSAPMTID